MTTKGKTEERVVGKNKQKERTWAKTVHTGDDEVDEVTNEDIPVGEIEGK